MAKKTYKITVDGHEIHLRLLKSGISALREKFNEDPRTVILGAATDPEYMAGLLDAALNYKGNDNVIKDGEELYDLLVDEGWSGQVRFGELAVNIGCASGLWTDGETGQIKKALQETTRAAYENMGKAVEQEDADPSAKAGK